MKHQRVTASDRFANVLFGREGRLHGRQLGRIRLGPHAAGLRLRRSSCQEASDCKHEGSLHTGSTITPPCVGAIGKRKTISRPVATLVAIMPNASGGVRTLIACQLRFRTSTVAFVNMFICDT